MEKECCSNVSSRLWGEALRDETKNGCEGDYTSTGKKRIHTMTNIIHLNHPGNKIYLRESVLRNN